MKKTTQSRGTTLHSMWLLVFFVMTLWMSSSHGFAPSLPYLTRTREGSIGSAFALHSVVDNQSSTSTSTSSDAATDANGKQEDEIPVMGQPGTAEMDVAWENLGFSFRPVKSHLRMTFANGQWGEPTMVEGDRIDLHIGATALHYGQSCFEGLKAFAHADGSVHLFRPDQNAARLRSSCERLQMAVPSTEQFVDACRAVVRDNVAYVPPYGSNGALYLRPLLFGSGPRIGLQPSDEYTLLIMAIPVGDYYAGGLAANVDCLLLDRYDRAAPRGVGAVKVAGNYAADLLPSSEGKKKGFPIGLYLDAATRSKVEEFSTSNFVGLLASNDDNGEKGYYVTPQSPSVLPSITNKSLQTIATEELGLTVQKRDIDVSELNQFDEVLACGTAVVLTPIGTIVRETDPGQYDTLYQYHSAGPSANDNENDTNDTHQESIGPLTLELYRRVRAIQNGEAEDKYGWNFRV